jgi:hypothetical protein
MSLALALILSFRGPGAAVHAGAAVVALAGVDEGAAGGWRHRAVLLRRRRGAPLSGWPSPDALPERFVLLAAVIEEPAKTAGALYVWVNAHRQRQARGAAARLPLPYTKDLHALLNEGMKKARQGISQMGTAEPRPGKRGSSGCGPAPTSRT